MHISGGRVPTVKAYRLFVNDFMHENVMLMRLAALKVASDDKTQAEQLLEQVVFDLAEESKLLAFAILPSGQTFYLGLSRLLLEPEFSDPVRISEIVDLIEHRDKFTTFIDTLEIDNSLRVYIGAENILPFMAATSLIITQYKIDKAVGAIGLLGPVRMNYPKSLLILKKIIEKYGLAERMIELPSARGYFLT
ncbi:MAG: hypothetical protein NTZ80_03050 [Patescibacteria group bacterium]|nr:hypothetical protein [Patescibacteria group bacterium]